MMKKWLSCNRHFLHIAERQKLLVNKMANLLSYLTFVGEDSEATAKAGKTHRQQLAKRRVVVIPTVSFRSKSLKSFEMVIHFLSNPTSYWSVSKGQVSIPKPATFYIL
jgi:hypothetical protein